MNCHFILQTVHHGIVDLDKKLPFLKTLFPNSKIEKKPIINDVDFIIARDIVENVKLISFKETTYDIPMQIDFCSTALFGYSFLDMQFEIPEEMVIDLSQVNFLIKGKILIDGEEQSLSSLITKILWPYYQSDKMIEIITDDKFMQSNRTDWEAMRETLLNEISTKLFFSADTPSGDMMGRPGHFLIEDYENIISMDSKWIDIGIHEKQVYHNALNTRTFLVKEKDLFKELHQSLIEMEMKASLLRSGLDYCSNFMRRINNKVAEIRKNIATSHDNKFYWKELKKNVEIIDLNFLEFHTTAVPGLAYIDEMPETLDLEFSEDFIKHYTKRKRKDRDLLFKCLDELKYAISNLATPGHTHDEHLLQEETEKVHEMLLMISFIAMAIPCGVAITTPNISIAFKIIAAIAIFSIPIIYFIFRKTQKTLAYKRNIKSELQRQYNDISASLGREKERQKTLDSMEELPEDLKQGITDIIQMGINAGEKRLRKLDKYK